MKKGCILAVVFVLLLTILPVGADSVWTPMDDYFMDTWKPESDNTCEHQARPFYLAAGKPGYVTALKTPLNRTIVNTYPNGTEFKIGFICGKGEKLFGAVEAVRLPGHVDFREDWKGESGYIPMGDLVRSFDADAFAEAYASEITPFDESGLDFCGLEEFVLWTAPNSGSQLEYVGSGYIEYMCTDYDPWSDADYRMYHFGGTYVDPNGNTWVEVTLRRETEHGWMCLDRLTEGGVEPVY